MKLINMEYYLSIDIGTSEIKTVLFDKNFKTNKFDWITYLSATSVYGDKNGQWVDEDTKPAPTSRKGLARLIAEANWLKYYKDFDLPVQIFRLSGIYSIENNAIKKLKKILGLSYYWLWNYFPFTPQFNSLKDSFQRFITNSSLSSMISSISFLANFLDSFWVYPS